MKNFVITAGTLTGNRGSEAMVTTCIQQIKKYYPKATICIATYYPKEDFKELRKPFFKKFNNVYIYSLTPFSLIFNYLPLSILCKIFPFLRNNNKQSKHFGSFLDLLKTDLVFDVAGISFVDGREKFLPYNILSIFPFLIHKIKVIKLPQALGPFNNKINYLVAKFILNKCERVYCRGQLSLKYAKQIKIKNIFYFCPDISFSLKNIDVVKFKSRPDKHIAISPSSLVMSKNVNYIHKLVEIIKKLQKEGFAITLIIHSWRKSFSSRNNDLIAANKINHLLENKLKIIGYEKNSTEIREEISKFEIVIVSRFHAMISALDTFTPVFVIGWSHKYLEILNQFGLGDKYCLDYSKLNVEIITTKIKDIYNNRINISELIKNKLPFIKKEINQHFHSIFNDIKN